MNILKPLETLIISLLDFFFSLTSNYGVSLILLSLSMTIIMFPLFIIAERIQKKDEVKKAGFKADLDKLNDVSNRQEKYFYTRRLYKIHNYHPISSLKSLIGLFIQIPFFMAAFRSLSAFEAFRDIPFLFISNLGQPDGLFYGINVLPVIMTCVNLVGSFIYAKGKDLSEKIQLVFIALIFLFLLYDMPAALLIYWTFNNFFAIFKNSLLQKNIFYRDIDLLKPLNIVSAKITGNKTFDGMRIKFIILQVIFSAVALTSLYLSDSAHHISLGFSIMKYLFVVYTIYLAYICLLHYKDRRFNIIYLITLCLFILSFLLTDYIIKRRTFFVISYFLFNITLFLSFFAYKIDLFLDRILPESLLIRKLTNKSIILYIALVTVINPTIIYNSSPVDFTYGYAKYIFICLAIFLVCSFIVNRVIRVLNKRLLNYLFLLSLIVLVSSLFNQFIFKGDYGILDNFSFKDNTKLYPANRYIISASSMAIAVVFLLLTIKNRFKYLHKILNFTSLFLILLSMFSFYTKQDSGHSINSDDFSIKKLPFSKTEPNIVVFYMDRLSSGLIGYALEEYPELLTELDGFDLYTSAISNGSSTLFGAPAALGGSEYTIEESNMRSNMSNVDKISESFSILPHLMKDSGFRVNVYGLPFFDRILLKDNIMDLFSNNLNNSLEEKWLSDPTNISYTQKDSLNLKNEVSNLLAISLFKNSLPAIRAHIYNKGRWFTKGGRIIPRIGEYSVLDYLSEISYIDEDSNIKGNYNWIESDFVHKPGGIGFDLIPSQDPQIKPADLIKFKNDKTTVYSYYNVVVFLNKLVTWIQWMKDNDVYDNTKIIIPSDHGYYYSVDYYFDKLDIPEDIDRRYLNYFHPALLSKDFNSDGALETDDRLISNSALVSMVLDGFVNNPINPYTGNIVKSLDPDEGLTMHFTLDWDLRMNPDKRLKYNNKYRVQGENLDTLIWEKLE